MKRILPVIIIAQFCCTSVWFAGNAVMTNMAQQFQLTPSYLAHLISAVQFGFIAGTLLFAIFTISDRFSPSKVFFTCAVIAASINLAIILNGTSVLQLIGYRFLTGFFLAGIYPIGMKIATDHFENTLGKSLGFLVAALVVGTAFPHLLKSLFADLSWKYVIISTSLLSVLGGSAILLLVPDGPFRKPSQSLKLNTFLQNFNNNEFKAAAFGYFGHMWELYAFWSFIPVILINYNEIHQIAHLNVPLFSFIIIGVGSLACVGSGLISKKISAKTVAIIALTVSCFCCLFSPIIFSNGSLILLLVFLMIWSIAVIADSPMFSTLVAQSATPTSKGTALTIVNCIGFAITIVSIQLLNLLKNEINFNYIFMVLAVGPILGLIALRSYKSKR